jgi:RNA polymerase sigma-70 factor (ECF subfamily)
MSPSEVWDRYVGRLVSEARRFLRPQARGTVDPEDVVASALVSYFHRCAGSGPRQEDDFLPLLVADVKRHCAKWNMRSRRHPAHPLQSAADEASRGLEPAAPGPSVDEVARFNELIDALARDLLDIEKEMLLLFLEGWGVADVAQRVGRVERTVRRFREKIWRKAHALGIGLAEDGASPES